MWVEKKETAWFLWRVNQHSSPDKQDFLNAQKKLKGQFVFY